MQDPALTGKKDDLSFHVKELRFMLNGQHKNNQNLNPFSRVATNKQSY
jgi:hypothetical protein